MRTTTGRGPTPDAEGLDSYGIKEIAIEFDTGDEEVLKPKLREEFNSYELHEAATYTSVGRVASHG